MARRFIPTHFNRDGTAKKSYPTKDAAREQGLKQGKNAYRCEFCGSWHIGG